MLYIGNLVNTHGIKGEVKIISKFKYKSQVFKKGNNLYINDEKLTINSYRPHKQFDMVTFTNIDNINDILKYKGSKVYIKKSEFTFSGPLNEDLYGKNVYDQDKKIGILKTIDDSGMQELLVIQNGEKKYLVPYVNEFVKEINETGIYLNVIKGLIDED